MKNDQETAAHTAYKADPEGVDSLQRGGSPHGSDVRNTDLCVGKREGCGQETLIGFLQNHRNRVRAYRQLKRCTRGHQLSYWDINVSNI
jgi:hypothetical protein